LEITTYQQKYPGYNGKNPYVGIISYFRSKLSLKILEEVSDSEEIQCIIQHLQPFFLKKPSLSNKKVH